MTDLHKAIKDALCKVVERLGIDRELLAVIGSYGDTMEDVQVLAAFRKYTPVGILGKAVHQARAVHRDRR
jgi:hypothetical protein